MDVNRTCSHIEVIPRFQIVVGVFFYYTRLAVEYYNGVPWTSDQIRKIARCACAGNAFPPPISKETISLRSRNASRHVRYARAMMHIEIAYPRWWVKRSRHSRSMRNLQFYVSGKRVVPNGTITSYAHCICTNYLKQLNARLSISSRIFCRFNP